MPEPAILIRLLGPFEVLRGAEPVALARRPAVLLAALALRLNTPVSYAAITDLLWSPEELPASSRRAIQTYASRLRDVLGRAAIVAHSDGLRLDLDPGQIDLHRFRRLAGAEAGAGSDELARLAEALRLWTGDPLSGLAGGQLAEAEGPALLEEVLGVAERHNELRLRLAAVDDGFVASLRRLVTDHPWRERSWCHLMLALYRGGRQGEALATFARLVTVLRDDLGIDPGAEATRLHQRMLAADPALLEPARPVSGPGRGPGPAPEPPAQLPAGSPAFVGRRRELSTLAALLDQPADRVRVAVVSGPAGVGKTTLAVEAAHRARARFPDGQLYAYGAGGGGAGVPAHDILGTFLRDLGVAADDVPHSPGDRTALFRTICARRRLLIVVDDAHSADQIAALLPGAGECAVLITTRRRLTVPANVSLDLDAMPAAESRELLARLVGADRLAAEPEATAAIVEACAGSPLALLIVGGRLATRPSWPLAYLRDRLAGPGRLAELRLDGRSVQAALDATTSTLDPADQVRFRRLGALPVDSVDVESAAALWRIGRAQARDLLDRLCDVRLLEPAAPDCYGWHGLIGSYLRSDAGGSDGAALAGTDLAGARRALRQAIASIAGARDRLRPGDRPHQPVIAAIVTEVDGVDFARRADVHTWLHPRLPLIAGLAAAALTAPDADLAVEAAALAPNLDIVLSECCGADDGIEPLLRAVTSTPLPPAAAHFVAASWQNLAAVLSRQGQFEEAREFAERAIEIWRRLGDRFGEAGVLNNLAVLHGRMGDYATAVEVSRRSIAAAEGQPLALRIRCLSTFAQLLGQVGEADAARAALAAALDLHVPEPGSFDAYLLRLADTYARLEDGRPDGAIASAEATLAAARQMASDRETAQSLVLLARARRQAGQDGSGAAAEALQLLVGHGHQDVQTTCEALAELAHAHRASGDLFSADACTAEAARLIERHGLRDTHWAGALLEPFPSARPAGDLPSPTSTGANQVS